MDRWEDMVLVGIIARPHGLRGEVLIQPETDFPEARFAEGATVYAEQAGTLVALVIDRSRMHQGRPLVGFQGFTTIEAVEALRRLHLRVPEAVLAPLADGEYYWYRYVGARVETETGLPVGVVARVEPTGGSGVLVVDSDQGEVQIPLIAALCPVLTPERIVVRPPDGLLDLNAPDPSTRENRHRHHIPRDGGGGGAGRRAGARARSRTA